MNERVFRFGENRSLLGVVCDPPDGAESGDGTALLFINSGLVHRVGPNRIYVNAAREVAAVGVLTMRFDLSGVGDSDARTDSLSFEERSVIEIRQAMDFLEASMGARKFILTGICSGADNALDAAVHDPRVLGIVPIDLYSNSSTAFLVHAYKRRLFSLWSWGRLLTGRSKVLGALRKRLARAASRRRGGEADEVQGGTAAGSEQACLEKLRHLARRGVHVCLVYSGDGPAIYNYRSLFEDALRATEFSGSFEAVHLNAADHEFTLVRHQKELVERIRDCVRVFGNHEPAPSTNGPTSRPTSDGDADAS